MNKHYINNIYYILKQYLLYFITNYQWLMVCKKIKFEKCIILQVKVGLHGITDSLR